MRSIDSCRLCGNGKLDVVLSLGTMPLADDMPTEAEARSHGQPSFPLTVVFCGACGLMQIIETVAPEILFGQDYPYFSSYSDGAVSNASELARRLIESRHLGPDSLVIEPASNDGYLLLNYTRQEVPVLGIDPVPQQVAVARERGVRSMQDFFGAGLAEQLAADGMKADVLHANNVLAHQADLNGFVEGIAKVLKPDGVAVIEMPYVRELIEHCEFDTIYHEHLCYFSLTSLSKLFERHGLHVNEVERLRIHGGSLRIYAESPRRPGESVKRLLAEERQLGIDGFDYYRDFGGRVEALKAALSELLAGLKTQGKRVAAYGAAAKGSTLINYLGIGRETLDYVVDRNVHKHGRVMPGAHVPIRATSELVSDRPDYVLMLSWNFAEEILRQQLEYRDNGGKFIIPVPWPQVV